MPNRSEPFQRITDFGPPNERFPSQYGHLTYKEWCEKEVERWRRAGIKIGIKTDKRGYIAIGRVG